MTLRDLAIERWWPATQSLDLIDGAFEDVSCAMVSEVQRFVHQEPLAFESVKVTSFDGALSLATEFAVVPTLYLVLPTRSCWVVIWTNAANCDGYDSLCWCLTENHGFRTIHWSAHDGQTTFQPGATLTLRRQSEGNISERTVCAAAEDGRWSFDQVGDPLPEEDLSSYKARRISDRFNERQVSMLLERLGARPWREEFYDFSRPVFVLRRPTPPRSVIRCDAELIVGAR